MRIFLALLRHESCGSACLVDSECSFPPYLLSVLQYHLGAILPSCSCFGFSFWFLSPAGFLGLSLCALFYLVLSLLVSFVSRRCLFRHVLVRRCRCGALRCLSR